MYIPKAFKQDDLAHIVDLIQKFPLATLIISGAEGLEAMHVPMIFADSSNPIRLQGHIAKANPLWQHVNLQDQVLLVFNGPNGYVSPSYYPSKQQNPRVVPTWNYTAVHVKGTLSVIKDADWNCELLQKLTHAHEAGRDDPWSISDAPQEYIQRMLTAIVGIEVVIDSMEAKWKLSQNQPELNQRGVVGGLEADDNALLSKLVKEHALDKAK